MCNMRVYCTLMEKERWGVQTYNVDMKRRRGGGLGLGNISFDGS